MYLPPAFAQRDAAALAAFVDAFPLGLLIRTDAQLGLAADPLPFIREAASSVSGTASRSASDPASDSASDPANALGATVLRAHVARANPLWQQLDGATVLVVFSGPNAYVSPGAYPSKAADGRVVPTWNYAQVQVRGTARVIQDTTWLRGLVERLTAVHERSLAQPWTPADAPTEYIEQLLRAIIGIEIAVTGWQGKWKLSQNRAPADHAGVRRRLATTADSAATSAATAQSHGAWLHAAMTGAADSDRAP